MNDVSFFLPITKVDKKQRMVWGYASTPTKDLDDEIISLDSTLPELTQLTMELSQPKYVRNEVGKLKVDKQPKGTKSPNLADGVMMVYNPSQRTEETWMRIAEMA